MHKVFMFCIMVLVLVAGVFYTETVTGRESSSNDEQTNLIIETTLIKQFENTFGENDLDNRAMHTLKELAGSLS